MTINVPIVVHVFMIMMAIRAMLGPLIQSQRVRPSTWVLTKSGAFWRVTPSAPRMMWTRPRGSAIQATDCQWPSVSAPSTWLMRPLF